MKVLYFDCFSGAGGDMLVGALLDAGASLERLAQTLSTLGLSGYQLRAEKVRKQGFAATSFRVELDPAEPQPHRHLHHVRDVLERGGLSAGVRSRALAAFERLADAEAAAHGTTRDKVHFHEVGAIDAIIDVTAAMLALEELAPGRIVCSPLPVGSGTVRCEHGVMPVPAPATALLLAGVPLAESAEAGELLTPTAAAVLTTVCDGFGPLPAMTIERVGMGAGTREGTTLPNVVRVMLGTAAEDGDDAVVMLEANLDDAPGEWVGHCLGRLLDHGVLDAYCVPIYMKKGRPGVVLTVICTPEDVPACETILFEETSTFGVRRHTVQRTKLERRMETVATPYGELRVKVGIRSGRTFSAAPEYEDCAAAAARRGIPLRLVMDAAMRCWREANG